MSYNARSIEDIEREVADDLEKRPKALLVRVHEELLYNEVHADEIKEGKLRERCINENILHAQKRLASLQVKISTRMEILMWITIAISLLAFIFSLFYCK